MMKNETTKGYNLNSVAKRIKGYAKQKIKNNCTDPTGKYFGSLFTATKQGTGV